MVREQCDYAIMFYIGLCLLLCNLRREVCSNRRYTAESFTMLFRGVGFDLTEFECK